MVNGSDFIQNTSEVLLSVDIANKSDNYVIPLRPYIWIGLFWLIAIIGSVGNSIVIWIVVAHKNMRTVTNLFLVNLAIADGLVATLDVPFVSYQMVFGHWPFGHAICKVNEFIATTSICVSVFTLSMIAIDRYTAIMYPFKLRMGLGKTITIIVLIWIICILVTIPNWLFVTLIRINTTNKYACGQIWPNNSHQTIYRVIVMILTYFLPLTCMTISYGRLSTVLWGSKCIGEKSENQLKKDLAKQKIVKMMIVVVVMFTICWLPFHIFFIISAAGLLKKAPQYIADVFMGAFWFAMSNSMYNPIIYCWMNGRFRVGFKKAFRWCPCIKYDSKLDDIHFPSISTGRKLVEVE